MQISVLLGFKTVESQCFHCYRDNVLILIKINSMYSYTKVCLYVKILVYYLYVGGNDRRKEEEC